MKLRSTILGTLTLAFALAGCGKQVANGVARPTQTGARALQNLDEARSMVTLRFKDQAQLQALAAAGVDLFENVDLGHRTVGATLTARTQDIVKKMGVGVTMQKQSVGVMGLPTGYKTVDDVNKLLAAAAAAHPEIMTVVELGKSIEGRPINALRVTKHPDTGLPAVRIQSGQHARELPTVELTTRLVDVLANGYGKDAQITKLIETRDIWILPVLNPDGRSRVEGGSSMWRKNARPLGMGMNGVDTNRNCDDHFESGNGSKWADDYHGEAPFSEPETQAYKALCEKMRFKVSLDIHNFGGMILWPPGFSNDLTPDEPRFKAIGETIGKSVGYKKVGTIARTIYKTFGDSATWEYAKFNTLAFAAELNDGQFNPSFGQVDKDWAAWRPNLLYVIDAAGNAKANHPSKGALLTFPGL